MWITVPPSELLIWPTPNFLHPQRRGPELIIFTSVFLSAAVFATSVRLYTRIFVRRFFGVDDGLLVVALIATFGVSTCVILGHTTFGWDVHLWDMNLLGHTPSVKNLFVSRILWSLASSLVRLSVLCLYYRLLRECRGDRYKWVLHCVTAMTVVFMLVFLGASIFTCTPIRAYWEYIPGKCINDRMAMFVCAILNTTSEFVVALLPIVAVHKLGVRPDQRWGVIGLLSLGLFVTFAGCFRTYYIWKIAHTYDVSWWAAPQWICSEVEIDSALICACAPSLRPVIGRWYWRLTNNLPVIHGSAAGPPVSEKETSQPRKYANNHDAVTAWEQALHRTIDLEGIGMDGLGYSVQIVYAGSVDTENSNDSRAKTSRKDGNSESNNACRPKKKPTKRRRWLWLGKREKKDSDESQCEILEDNRDYSAETERPQPVSAFAITTSRSVQVSETMIGTGKTAE